MDPLYATDRHRCLCENFSFSVFHSRITEEEVCVKSSLGSQVEENTETRKKNGGALERIYLDAENGRRATIKSIKTLEKK